MKIIKEDRNKIKYNFPQKGDLEGDSKILGFTPNKNLEEKVYNIMKKNEFIYNSLAGRKKKKKEFGYFSSLNPNAGDVEKGADFFNSTIADGASGLTEETELEQRQRIFNEIKKINPNANYDNYSDPKKMPIGKMIAIRNNYINKQKLQNQQKEKENEINHKTNYSKEVYFDDETGDFMIKGLNVGFDTEKEAIDYLRELEKEE